MLIALLGALKATTWEKVTVGLIAVAALLWAAMFLHAIVADIFDPADDSHQG